MAVDYSTTALIAKAKLWGAIPNQQPAFTNAQILDIMSDELRAVIGPMLIQFREEYFVSSSDFTITTETTEFAIPTRAVAGGLREVKLVDSDDNESDLPIIDMQKQQRHSFGYFLQGNKVKIIEPQNFTTYTLRLFYFVRQPTLVVEADTATVDSVGASTFTVASLPGAMVSGQAVDIIREVPPFDILSQNITMTFSGLTITPSVMPTDLAVGDYMTNVQESPIPLIPVEAHPLLVQATVVKFNEILSDSKGLKNALDKYNTLEASLRAILSPRVQGDLKSIINYDNFYDLSQNRIQNYHDIE